jgi:hypothetical protein
VNDTIPESRTKPDFSGWLTAAALFWFEVCGMLGLAFMAVLPMVAFMHGRWPPDAWIDGTAIRLVAILAVVGATVIAAWMLAPSRPRLGAAIFTALGLVGMAGILAAAQNSVGAIAAVALWLAWPSAVLLRVWGPRLRPATSPG